jgi:PTS system nitrogen regulatory IIA component
VQDVGHLAAVDTQTLTDSFMEREALGSTGIGEGVACPHGGHQAVDHPFGTVAISRPGVAFDALDGGLVYVIFLAAM